MIRLLVLVVLIVASPVGLSAAEGLTLREAFQKALKQSETVAIREEEIRAAEARYLQLLGQVLPHLEVNASELIQDRAKISADGGATETFSRRSRPEVAITLTQPLFQGFREIIALKVSDADKKKTQFERDRAEQLLFLDVARAFYTVYDLEEEEKVRVSIRSTLQKRIQEVRERIAIGRSRESEQLSLEAEVAAVEADIEATHGLVKTARQLLGFLMGAPTEEPLVDALDVPDPLEPLQGYRSDVEERPDLRANLQAIRLAHGQVGYEKGSRYPFIDLEANYYPYRVGFLSDIDWDLFFTLNFPIFRGGETRGRIRAAEASLKQTQLADEEARRRAELQTRNAYIDAETALARRRALRHASVKAEANYQAQSEDYRLGLVNQLEVLQALRDWQERRLESSRATYRSKVAYLELQVASGHGLEKVLQ